MPLRIPLFRIWYSTTYTVLLFITLVFLAVTPTETIYQSIRSDEIQKIFVIGGAYLLTFLVVLLVYSTRLYTNRSVLATIPKPYIPIEDGEVGRLVRRMIVKALKRSALVAWDSRPRDARREGNHDEVAEGRPATAERHFSTIRRQSHFATTVVPVSADAPPWGHVSHPGWASPALPDLPNLQYWNVVTELPNLIEAKAVSLAPPDPAMDEPFHMQDTPVLPDASVVALLQRPRAMGLRDYLGRLGSYGLINPPGLGPNFIAQYEHARFSTQMLTEAEFRNIMTVFADILNGMSGLDPAMIEEARAESIGLGARSLTQSKSSGSSSTTSPDYRRTPRPSQSYFSYEGSEYKTQIQTNSESPQTVRTALSLPRNPSTSAISLPRTPSQRSFASASIKIHRVRSSPSTILPNSSSSSLRSVGSIIRLHPDPRPGAHPYHIQFDGGQEF